MTRPNFCYNARASKEPNGTRTVATIYDWKEGNLRCRRGEYNWHVGGLSQRAVELVQQLLAA